MATIVAANQTYNAGDYTVGPLDAPAGSTLVSVSATRDNWAKTTTNIINVVAEISYNGGVAWAFLASFATKGGDHIRRDGSIAPGSGMKVPIEPTPSSPLAQVRVKITVNRRLSTAINLSIS